MSDTRHAQIEDLAAADAIIDARTPAEFALDHIPGAINCPVLSDDQRRVVGTTYKQEGAFEARRIGGAMVAENLAMHLRTRFHDRPRGWTPVVYCWRGGLRSGSMVQWMRLVGWDARQLGGGYKRYRRHVIETIEALAPRLRFRVVCGATGSAKTRVLHALAARGEQTLDLEGAADHKGSVLGGTPGGAQPTQKRFENRVATALARLDSDRTVWVEAESRKIGRVALPTVLLDALRAAPCVEIVASRAARLAFLLRDYAYLGDDREHLAGQIELLRELQSNETIARWREWALAGALAALFDELMTMHYDPLYARSQGLHYRGLREGRQVETDDLDDGAIAALAAEIVAARPS